MDVFKQESKMRIIQESVPGKQLTLAHVIANPDPILYEKVNLKTSKNNEKSALGILMISPSEMAIIAADIAMKTSGVQLGDIDRYNGSLVILGNLSEVEAAIEAIIIYIRNKLGFSVCEITKT